jgi:hypothetical protein
MPEETKKSLQSLQQEREELELEQLREDVGKRRAARELRKEQAKEQEQAFLDEAAKQRSEQARCNHKKGGRDFASVQLRGDGENHAIMAWQHPTGPMWYLCSHCHFWWKPGITEKFMEDGKTPNPTGISYAQAAKLPTDNSPAGSVLFGPRLVA